ncbi:hypothetical protein ACFPES_12950 [Paenibacillus sp. GCM10023248]|uniref:hypothetical protein n=1 Tax=unclassified Paenibacillus TaxID=185978 RepID=UPI002379218C|nr:hypothetical protein [Paenibacillus sp. MAHUQ-63]MDD9267938.1 hypothetical protein [Paenibacillus sp. MAHUQ-63]
MHALDNNRLFLLLRELGAKLTGNPPSTKQNLSFEELIVNNELEDNEAIPTWLMELLSKVNAGEITGVWIDFTRDAGDDTHVFTFIRELNEALPIQYENNEESWLLTWPQLNLEVCISFEGSCYKISRIGDTWDIEE